LDPQRFRAPQPSSTPLSIAATVTVWAFESRSRSIFNVQSTELKDSPSARSVTEQHEAWKTDIPQDDQALWDWLAGDGTGAGKGRQVGGILLDNWLRGRRRALWISKSDKLIEDAQRDWSALGVERLLVTPLSRFRRGTPIRLAEGVLFTTYATLRTDERGEKLSRVRQIVDWLGSGFDGVIIFDESHAMQNAVGAKSERGDQAASQQGRGECQESCVQGRLHGHA
jgi:hypothetical protein